MDASERSNSFNDIKSFWQNIGSTPSSSSSTSTSEPATGGGTGGIVREMARTFEESHGIHAQHPPVGGRGTRVDIPNNRPPGTRETNVVGNRTLNVQSFNNEIDENLLPRTLPLTKFADQGRDYDGNEYVQAHPDALIFPDDPNGPLEDLDAPPTDDQKDTVAEQATTEDEIESEPETHVDKGKEKDSSSNDEQLSSKATTSYQLPSNMEIRPRIDKAALAENNPTNNFYQILDKARMNSKSFKEMAKHLKDNNVNAELKKAGLPTLDFSSKKALLHSLNHCISEDIKKNGDLCHLAEIDMKEDKRGFLSKLLSKSYTVSILDPDLNKDMNIALLSLFYQDKVKQSEILYNALSLMKEPLQELANSYKEENILVTNQIDINIQRAEDGHREFVKLLLNPEEKLKDNLNSDYDNITQIITRDVDTEFKKALSNGKENVKHIVKNSLKNVIENHPEKKEIATQLLRRFEHEIGKTEEESPNWNNVTILTYEIAEFVKTAQNS